MYTPPAFKEDRPDAQHDFIRAHPFGLLISAGAGGLQASPLPFHLIPDGSLGHLQGHLSRANPHWAVLSGQDVLIAFQGAHAYVTPSWYRSKAAHGKVVPTWNYTMVQVRGPVRVIEERDWLRRHIALLTNDHESRRAEPWHVTDAPEDFIESHIKGIVGLEITIREMEGKWKVSQNRAIADRAGVADGLSNEGHHDLSELVRRYGGSEI
jgi:transcriptional regulator